MFLTPLHRQRNIQPPVITPRAQIRPVQFSGNTPEDAGDTARFSNNTNYLELYQQHVQPWLAMVMQMAGSDTVSQLPFQQRLEQAEMISNTLWEQYLAEKIQNEPEDIDAMLKLYEDRLQASGTPGIGRDGALWLTRYIQKNLDKPEKLKQVLTLMTLTLMSGGYQKLDHLLPLMASPEFQQASQEKRDQMLVEGMGPIMIKSLQTLSTVPDLFPPYIQKSIEPLYEKNTPMPFFRIQSRIEKELGKPLEEAFATFDKTPIKAGSIAQVHQATLHDGRKVAVKVVKDVVEESLEEDLALMEPLSQMAQHMAPNFDAQAFMNGFADLMRKECDMQYEAGRLKQVEHKFARNKSLHVPEVIESHTTPHLLTMEFVPGENLLAFKGDSQVANKYLSGLMDQVLAYGACQADPHPGNLPYDKETQRFGFLDAGLVYFVSDEERNAFSRLLVALAIRDTGLLAKTLLKETRQPVSKALLKEFQQKIQSRLDQASDLKDTPRLLGQLEHDARSLGLQTEPVNPLLWKTLFTGFGVAKTLDNQVNIPRVVGWKVALRLLRHNPAFLLSAAASQLKMLAKSMVSKVQGGWHGIFKSFANPPETIKSNSDQVILPTGLQVNA